MVDLLGLSTLVVSLSPGYLYFSLLVSFVLDYRVKLGDPVTTDSGRGRVGRVNITGYLGRKTNSFKLNPEEE